MPDFDWDAPADLFPSRSRRATRLSAIDGSTRRQRRFHSAIEQMPAEYLSGTVLEVSEERIGGARIRELYDSAAYPLMRKRM